MADSIFKWFGSNIKQDESNRLVSDTEKETWNNKADKNHTHNYLPLDGGTLTGPLTLNSSLYADGSKVSITDFRSLFTLGVRSLYGNEFYITANSKSNSVFVRYGDINFVEYCRESTENKKDNIIINTKVKIQTNDIYDAFRIGYTIEKPYAYKNSNAIEKGVYLNLNSTDVTTINGYVYCENKTYDNFPMIGWQLKERFNDCRLYFYVPIQRVSVNELTFEENGNPFTFKHSEEDTNGLLLTNLDRTIAYFSDKSVSFGSAERIALNNGVTINPSKITLYSNKVNINNSVEIEKDQVTTLIGPESSSMDLFKLSNRFIASIGGPMYGYGSGLKVTSYPSKLRFTYLRPAEDGDSNKTIEEYQFMDMEYNLGYNNLYLILGDKFKGLKYGTSKYIDMDSNSITLETKAITLGIEPMDSESYFLGQSTKRWGSVYSRRLNAKYIANVYDTDVIYMDSQNSISVNGDILPYTLSRNKNIGSADSLWDNVYSSNIRTKSVKYIKNEDNHITFSDNIIELQNSVACGDMKTGVSINNQNIDIYSKNINISNGTMSEGLKSITLDLNNGIISGNDISSSINLKNPLTIVKGGISYVFDNSSAMTINLDGESGDISTTILKHIKIAEDANDTDYISFTSNGVGITSESNTITTTGNILPSTTLKYTLGSTNNKWNYVYTNSLYVNELTTQSGNDIKLNCNIVPSEDGAYTLGSETNVWNCVYSLGIDAKKIYINYQSDISSFVGQSDYYLFESDLYYPNTNYTLKNNNFAIVASPINGCHRISIQMTPYAGAIGSFYDMISLYALAGNDTFANKYKVVAGANILPTSSNMFSLGASSKKWDSVYTNDLYTDAMSSTSNGVKFNTPTNLITGGTTDIGEGATLQSGTLYCVYE